MSINMSINFVYIVAGLKLLKTGNLQYETEDVLLVCFNPPREGKATNLWKSLEDGYYVRYIHLFYVSLYLK